MKHTIYLFLCSFLIINCHSPSDISAQSTLSKVPDFDSYWYQSKAEITSYDLQQARYGEIHKGTATTIFVTEPFNTKTQVKADNAMANNTISVLKLNQTRKFNTGIYPYSTMTSSFTPIGKVGQGSTQKITTSVQEWCGQVFMQLNNKGTNMKIQSFSYFESESDQQYSIKNSLLEDEIMSIIRINPQALPTGKVSALPSTLYLRMMHKAVQIYQANASLSASIFNEKEVQTYTLEYANLERTIKIHYENKFPFKIEGWEETYKSYTGKQLTTVATRKKELYIDYWNKNSVKDSTLYMQLFDF